MPSSGEHAECKSRSFCVQPKRPLEIRFTLLFRFIWAKYQIAKICYEVTKGGVEKALAELPHDLDEMYSEILQGIKTRYQQSPQTSTMAENALTWVLCAARPLSSTGLIEAVSITPEGGTQYFDSDGLTVQTMLDICQPLLVLDSQLGVFRFAHFSVQEFLMKQFTVDKSHTHVAEACLTLLMNYTAGDYPPSMLGYATVNWAAHVRLSGAGINTLTNLCTAFLRPSPAYENWISNVSGREGHRLLSSSSNPLLVACYYQLVDVCAFLLRPGTDLNPTNDYGHSSLHVAAMHGSHDIARLLLEREGVEMDSKDRDGRTPLSWAVEEGYVEVVQMLLEKGAEVDSKDSKGRTSLSWAAAYGRGEVMQLLFEKGAEVDSKDSEGRTSLSWAAECGYERVVQMLLEKGAEVDSKDRKGRTPLSWAAEFEHEEVMQMLRNRMTDRG